MEGKHHQKPPYFAQKDKSSLYSTHAADDIHQLLRLPLSTKNSTHTKAIFPDTFGTMFIKHIKSTDKLNHPTPHHNAKQLNSYSTYQSHTDEFKAIEQVKTYKTLAQANRILNDGNIINSYKNAAPLSSRQPQEVLCDQPNRASLPLKSYRKCRDIHKNTVIVSDKKGGYAIENGTMKKSCSILLIKEDEKESNRVSYKGLKRPSELSTTQSLEKSKIAEELGELKARMKRVVYGYVSRQNKLLEIISSLTSSLKQAEDKLNQVDNYT
jgi:hypothetical protein